MPDECIITLDKAHTTGSVSSHSTGEGTGAIADSSQHKHLSTDHLLGNLKSRTISGAYVTVTSQGLKFALTMASTVIMRRILWPQDFGLFYMVLAITGFMRVFKDAGLSMATIQREGITHAQVSNLFWVNVAISASTMLVVAALSPAVAWFYREPRLISMTLALSLTFLLSGSAVQHTALMERQMRYTAIAVIEVGSLLISLITGVVMALLGFRYWSLVGAALALEAATFISTWTASRWRPQLPTRGCGTKSLLHFGIDITASNFIYTLFRGTDAMLVGRKYGSAPLGLYSSAGALLMRPIDQLLSPLMAVFVPALSRMQNQPERYRTMFLRMYEVVAMVSFTFGGLFLALARPVTLIVLGSKWEKAADIFGGFTLAALCAPLGASASWLFLSQGRGRDMFKTTTINSVIMVTSFFAGLPFGPLGVAIGYSLSSLVRLPIFYYRVGKTGPVTTNDLWKVFFTNLPFWGVSFAAAFAVRAALDHSSLIIQLLLGGTAALLAASALVWFVPRHREKVLYFLRTLQQHRARSL